MSVTINPKAPIHSIYLGLFPSDAFSIKSKSNTKFSAAITTTNKLNKIPIPPFPKIPGICIPKKPNIKLAK